MKKILIVVVALLATAYAVLKGDVFSVNMTKDGFVAKFDHRHSKEVEGSNKAIADLELQVACAKSNYAKLEQWSKEAQHGYETAYRRKSEIVKELEFIRDRATANEPVRLKNGKALSDDELDVEIGRRETELASLEETAAFYKNEGIEIEKQMDLCRDLAVSGPFKVEALKLAQKRMNEQYEFQRKRLVSMDGYDSRTLKDAYENAVAKLDEAKAALGLADPIPELEIDFGEKAKDAETKHQERLARLNAMLGEDKPSDDENAVAFE